MTTSIYNRSTYTGEDYTKNGHLEDARIRKPRVVFTRECFDKITHFVQKCPVECSGFGTVEKKEGYYLVTDAWLLEQSNSGTSTEIEPEAMNRLLFQSRNSPGELNFWWHSHVNMNVFWSGTDTATIEQIGRQGWCLATVFNKRGEMKSAVYLADAFKDPTIGGSLFLDDLQTSAVAFAYDDETLAAWEAEYKKSITDVEEKYRAKKEEEYRSYVSERGARSNGSGNGNSLSGMRDWRDESNGQMDFSAVESRGYDRGAMVDEIDAAYNRQYGDRSESHRAVRGLREDDIPVVIEPWMQAYEDEIKEPPAGMTKMAYIRHLKRHKNILVLRSLDEPFEYFGWMLAKKSNLIWAQNQIIRAEFKSAAEVKNAKH